VHDRAARNGDDEQDDPDDEKQVVSFECPIFDPAAPPQPAGG
jgi:hypothetical protein